MKARGGRDAHSDLLPRRSVIYSAQGMGYVVVCPNFICQILKSAWRMRRAFTQAHHHGVADATARHRRADDGAGHADVSSTRQATCLSGTRGTSDLNRHARESLWNPALLCPLSIINSLGFNFLWLKHRRSSIGCTLCPVAWGRWGRGMCPSAHPSAITRPRLHTSRSSVEVDPFSDGTPMRDYTFLT